MMLRALTGWLAPGILVVVESLPDAVFTGALPPDRRHKGFRWTNLSVLITGIVPAVLRRWGR